MARRHLIAAEEDLRIPPEAFAFEGFLKWADSSEFPAAGRIDFLNGEVDVDMSPEDLYTHGVVKTAIALTLESLVAQEDLGDVFIDRTSLRSAFAKLSVEPDVIVVLLSSLESGAVRLVPAAGKGPDRFSALEGAPDLVVEIVSDGSVEKDTKVLPRLYAKAGVPELWLVDARAEKLRFTIFSLREGCYEPAAPDPEGWAVSSRLGKAFRLVRERRPGPRPWRYFLEHR